MALPKRMRNGDFAQEVAALTSGWVAWRDVCAKVLVTAISQTYDGEESRDIRYHLAIFILISEDRCRT